MIFFAVPYEIHFDDTMAYGTHHFLTNFKFQCAGREHLLFSEHLYRQPDFAADFDRVLLLTYEGYTRNLAPARLGDRLVVLVSVEERGEVGLRFCFRTLRADGEPVAAGYQTILCAARETGKLTPFPPAFKRRFDEVSQLSEAPSTKSFRDRLHLGGRALNEVFSPEIRALAQRLMRGELTSARIVDGNRDGIRDGNRDGIRDGSQAGHQDGNRAGIQAALPTLASAQFSATRVTPLELPEGAVAFLLAGQGNLDPGLLSALIEALPDMHAELERCVEVVDACLGIDARPLFFGSVHAARDALAKHPDLDQVAIFTAGVLGARLVEHRGLKAHVMMGHSFGEIAALTAGGALDLRLGTRVVCERVRALRTVGEGVGTLAAVGLSRDVVAKLLTSEGFKLDVAGTNHAAQTVVAGTRVELERLRDRLASEGRPLTFIDSRYPFHSRALMSASSAFETALHGWPAVAPTRPVWSPIEGGLYQEGGEALGATLASQLLRPFDTESAINALWDAGVRHFVDCGTRGRFGRIAAKALKEGRVAEFSDVTTWLGTSHPAPVLGRVVQNVVPLEVEPKAVARRQAARDEHPVLEPVAIVSLGCVLPGGGKDPDAYWRQIRDGSSGIVDWGQLEPALRADFLSSEVEPDRAYTLLAGRVHDGDIQTPKGMDPARFSSYGRGQKLLAMSLAQCLGALNSKRPAPSRIRCLLGSTGDGYAEYDQALTLQNALHSASEGSGIEMRRAVEAASTALQLKDPAELAPFPTIRQVVADGFGAPIETALLDAACASSLYTLALGTTLLQSGEAELVFAGGVFSPSPANNCLFSQFKGLSAKGSRPFDVHADGVIFGEGSGMVALKRLSAAIADGDQIHAVVRGVGLSSDGRSSSANVPRVEGQVLAMERCYATSGVDPSTVQLVEAHGTATPAGDSTELRSLARFFGGRQTPLELGSVKALVGHVGWAAGSASLIKLCLAMRHKTIPRQYNFEAPGEALAAIGDTFRVARQEHGWAENGILPRRAATNGFGFGGTNAHVLLEEYVPAFHQALVATSETRLASELAVVALDCAFPDVDGLPSRDPDAKGAHHLKAAPLPSNVRLLPDIGEDMDLTQGLAVEMVDRLLRPTFEAAPGLKAETCLILALEGKTGRGVEATGRVLAPMMARQVREVMGRGGEAVAAAAQRSLLDNSRASGPYTLQGMMPNVTPGRAANLLDLKGANFVIDAGEASFAEALQAARVQLAGGASIAVVGSLAVAGEAARSGGRASERRRGDGAVMLALTTLDAASRLGLPVKCRLHFEQSVTSASVGADRGIEARVASGIDRGVDTAAVDVARSMTRAVRAALAGSSVELSLPGVVSPLALSLHGPGGKTVAAQSSVKTATSVSSLQADPVRGAASMEPPAGFSHSAEVGYYAPVLVERSIPAVAREWRGMRVLVLGDQADSLREARDVLSAAGAVVEVMELAGTQAGGTPVDPDDEVTTVRRLSLFEPDLILAITRPDAQDEAAVMRSALARRGLLELFFLAARTHYARVAAGETFVVALAVGGLSGRLLHPATGLYAGMLKSLAREVPAGKVRMMSTSAGPVAPALHQLARELAGAGVVEVAWDRNTRLERTLELTARPSAGAPLLKQSSVVLATGGARGVTAVLVKALLERFQCTVVLLGRTDPGRVPERFLHANEADLDRLERDYYAEEVARDPSVKAPELLRRFESYRSANEIMRTLEALRVRGGQVRYLPVDVTSARDVEAAMATLQRDYGRLDLIIHGAGVQTSKKLDKRKVSELRRTLDTKLSGLGLLQRAAAQTFLTPPRLHVLTSAFSYFGNDGQADYGAANETLDRLCAWQTARLGAGAWTSVGWLAWDRIGMTRSSEYSVLGALRGLHGVRAEEGASLFLSLVTGTPTSAINVQMTPGERAWYGIDVVEASTHEEREVRVDAGNIPALPDHLVRGVPTLPGAYALDQMAQAAAAAGVPTEEITGIRFSRFVRVKPGKAVQLRAQVERRAGKAHVRLVGDVTHASGVVLEKDVLYAQATFGSRASATLPEKLSGPTGQGVLAGDPYTSGAGTLQLGGIFTCLRDITLEKGGRFARVELSPEVRARAGERIPALLLDAAWRLSAMYADGAADKLFAPISFGRIEVDEQRLRTDGPLRLTLRSGAPQVEGAEVHCGVVEIVDERNRVVVRIADGLARVMEA